MLPKNVMYYGEEAPLPWSTPLRAGPLSLIYQAGDLRYIKLGDHEIIRRVYVAIRDRGWGTVPASLSNVEMAVEDDAFRITYDVANVQGEIDFHWAGTITGDAQGRIEFSMDGVARSTFLRNRIGICVLHPMRECAGQPCIVEKVDGAIEHGTFPDAISPHQPFVDMRAIAHEILPGLRTEVRFSGDVFEMEDQRNWTDASFKTYSTPLSLSFPVQVNKGTRISQSVMITLEGDVPVPEADRTRKRISFGVGARPIGPMPRIGLGMASHRRGLSSGERALLKSLRLSHLRVDLDLAEPDFEFTLRQASEEARALGVKLEVALFFSEAVGLQLRRLAAAVQRIRPPVYSWLVLRTDEQTTTEELANLTRECLAEYDPRAKIAGGTNLYFTELNRQRPPVKALDLVCYSLNPQVHAFDHISLIESLETQAVTVESARRFIGGLPLAVGPVTLKPRSSPRPSGAELATGGLPSQVDVRQMSLLGAGWTAVSLKYLAESGAYSTTYYETTGWRGVMEIETGSPMPDAFRSLPGSVFPLYHVLADVADFAGGDVVPTTSSDTLRVDGLALQRDGSIRVLLANLTAARQRVRVENLGERVFVRRLDETTVGQAMTSPAHYRAQERELLLTGDGAPELDLLPYAVVCMDAR